MAAGLHPTREGESAKELSFPDISLPEQQWWDLSSTGLAPAHSSSGWEPHPHGYRHCRMVIDVTGPQFQPKRCEAPGLFVEFEDQIVPTLMVFPLIKVNICKKIFIVCLFKLLRVFTVACGVVFCCCWGEWTL